MMWNTYITIVLIKMTSRNSIECSFFVVRV